MVGGLDRSRRTKRQADAAFRYSQAPSSTFRPGALCDFAVSGRISATTANWDARPLIEAC
jgi:hypothetical protein